MEMFIYWLADKKCMTVRLLLQSIDSLELTKWIAYYKAVERMKEQPDEQSLTEKLKQIPGTIKPKRGKK